jgi:hypothetical protein
MLCIRLKQGLLVLTGAVIVLYIPMKTSKCGLEAPGSEKIAGTEERPELTRQVVCPERELINFQEKI